MMKKTIPIEQLTPGMYMVGVDQSWLKTPFLFHRRLLKRQEEIALLKQHGIRLVDIDPSRGLDVGEARGPADTGAPPRPTTDPAAAAVVTAADAHDPPGATPPSPRSLTDELAASRIVRDEALAAVRRVFEGVKTGGALDGAGLKQVVTALTERLLDHRASMTTLVLLQQMRRANGSLFEHSVDVCVLALVVAKDHGMEPRAIEQLGLGALLHDIGQMRLPQTLLRKSGAFTKQERKLIRMHTKVGAMIVAQTQTLDTDCRRIVLEHHETMDGTGYPDGLAGDRLSLMSQIVGLVDRYDALASRRGGRPGMLPAQAIRALYHLGLNHRFDQALVERMIHSLGVYPVGSLVELNTGERGIVLAVNPTERLRPTVKLMWAASGRPYAVPSLLDLAAQRLADPERTIRRILDPVREGVDITACIDEIAGSLGFSEAEDHDGDWTPPLDVDQMELDMAADTSGAPS